MVTFTPPTELVPAMDAPFERLRGSPMSYAPFPSASTQPMTT